ncbi:hypothetical protein FSP39_011309 [Pinctada imbricata]|uniref:TGF-beta family profile domain-containing protein n=1 Tax=Pinctada imbricata TaxID=66713 RepID=A0AA88XRL9_PINIB|nr:hypothetical protein FSP39_011309 [Pinctada imbricata]
MRVFLTIRRDDRKIRTHVYQVKPISRSEHLAIDVTALARPWVEGYNGRVSLQAQIKACSNVTCGPIPASSSHLLLFTQDNSFLEELHRSGAFSLSNSSFVPHVIEKRDTSRSLNINSNSRRKNIKDRYRTKKRRRVCSSSKLIVDFKHLGWARYIVIPKSYDARLCRGSCPSPVKPELSPTNHALIQSLMRLGNTRRIPMPCCVPKTLLPLSMLYYHGEEVVIRHHKDMIVESCACR